MVSIAKVHLVLYNLAQTVGWSACCYQLIRAWVAHPGGTSQDYKVIHDAGATLARTFQAASILDTVHAVLGLVPSNPALGLLQWAGRCNVLFLVLGAIPQVQGILAAALVLLVWALSEVIRYPWYALTSLNACPAWLTWLRYTAFIPLYPIGLLSEMVILYKAIPYVQARHLYSVDLPNAFNMSFNYATFIKVGLWIYIPVWWNLYASLLRQRSKKLGSAKEKSA